MTFLEDTHLVSKFASLACATVDTATVSDFPYPWKFFACRIFATCFCHVVGEMMSIFLTWVTRATHEQPAPHHNESASQHIRTSAQPTTNNKKPTTTNNICTVTRTATTPFTATTAATRSTKEQQEQLFHQPAFRVPERRLFRIDARACAVKKSHKQQQQHLQHQMTSQGIKQSGNSVAASGDSGSALPACLFRTANRTRVISNPRWSIIKSDSVCKCFGIVWFSQFFVCIVRDRFFSVCIAVLLGVSKCWRSNINMKDRRCLR